jgi:RNA recognition motif-containing protein
LKGGKVGVKLYVGNLSFQASEKDLEELFEKAGHVESVKIITDLYSGQSRGFAFVEMASNDDAKKAIEMFNGKSFKERVLVVNEARPQRTKGPGRREGRGRRERF